MNTVYRIDYKDLLEQRHLVLQYAISQCDYFSLITRQLKPYSRIPPHCLHDSELVSLLPQLKQQHVGIRSWSNNNASDNHTVMNVYSCTRAAVGILESLLFPELHQGPTDLCFYKGRTVWLSTVTHEELAFLYLTSPGDLSFFLQAGIKCFNTAQMDAFVLPNL